jgi:serine/threonine-protein kinase RsbW
MTHTRSVLRLDLQSHVDVLDYVQAVCDQMCGLARLDDDAVHWVGVAVRESVINAIKHGNRENPDKQVHVEFSFLSSDGPEHLEIRVQDEGEGFDPEEVDDPLAPENLLKASGRGIFFMRSFMDELVLQRRPEGGMEVRMRKQIPTS